MRKEKIHIRTLIEGLLDRFKGLEVRYEFKEFAGVHFIEVTPATIFESEKFVQFQHAALEEFYREFPERNLAFITRDSLVKITHPEIVTSPEVQDKVVLVAFGDPLEPEYTIANATIGYLTINDLRIQQEATALYCLPSSGITQAQYVRIPVEQGLGRVQIMSEDIYGVVVSPTIHIDDSQLNWTMISRGLPLVTVTQETGILARLFGRSEKKKKESSDMESSHNYALAS
jgi:hypothetical protein